MLLLTAMAFADPSSLTGQFTMITDPAAVEAAQQAELERSLASLPSLLRPLASPLLRPTLFYCKSYHLVVTPDSFSNQCDDKPLLQRPINRDALPLQVGDLTFTSRVSVEGDQVVLVLEGEHGTRTTRYTPTPSGLHVDVSVSSPRLDTPLTWSIEYRRI